MKKICIFALVLVFALSLAACGRKDNNETSSPSTDMTIIPDIDPTIGTNIPDPSVDTSMPLYTDGNGMTDETGNTGMTGPVDGRTRSGM